MAFADKQALDKRMRAIMMGIRKIFTNMGRKIIVRAHQNLAYKLAAFESRMVLDESAKSNSTWLFDRSSIAGWIEMLL